MGKIFVLAPRENWICDRIADEWYKNCKDISTSNILDCDIIWLLAGWCWNQVNQSLLQSKKVVVTIHHIVPEKFTQDKLNEFKLRDRFIDMYHVPNSKTFEMVKMLTTKPIRIVGYWFDKGKWYQEEKYSCRKKLDLPLGDFIVGSFQRDTEGGDLITPKLEKGPDLFCDYVTSLEREDLHVLLGGWRRQYIISRLKSEKIKYTYFELASLDRLRSMYNALDLYIISSRYEGGPQSALEAAGMSIPIISTDVGMVSNILNSACVFDNLDPKFQNASEYTKYNLESASKFEINNHKHEYIKMFKELL